MKFVVCSCRSWQIKSFQVFTYNEAFDDCGVHKCKRSGWYIREANAKLEVKNKTRLANKDEKFTPWPTSPQQPYSVNFLKF